MQYYSEDHVWVRPDRDGATVGISRHAAAELGEVTFVELPTRGARVAAGDLLCVVESVKTAADVACPVQGTVQDVNALLLDQPSLVNASPEADGWLCRLCDVPAGDLASLMTDTEYAAAIAPPPAP
jgi:glycine cleavage system H protein